MFVATYTENGRTKQIELKDLIVATAESRRANENRAEAHLVKIVNNGRALYVIRAEIDYNLGLHLVLISNYREVHIHKEKGCISCMVKELVQCFKDAATYYTETVRVADTPSRFFSATLTDVVVEVWPGEPRVFVRCGNSDTVPVFPEFLVEVANLISSLLDDITRARQNKEEKK